MAPRFSAGTSTKRLLQSHFIALATSRTRALLPAPCLGLRTSETRDLVRGLAPVPARFHSSHAAKNDACASCPAQLNLPAVCRACGTLQPLVGISHFDLLNGGRVEFDDGPGSNLSGLKRRFLDLQSAVHPDGHASTGGQTKVRAEAWSAAANRAFQALKDPLPRALYILELQGNPLREEDAEAPQGLLMEVLETSEELQETQDPDVVARIREANDLRAGEVVDDMKEAFAAKDWDAFKRGAVELRYRANVRAACDGWVGGGRRAEMLH